MSLVLLYMLKRLKPLLLYLFLLTSSYTFSQCDITISNSCLDTLRSSIVLTNTDLISYAPIIDRGCLLNNIDFDLHAVKSASGYAISSFFHNVNGAPLGAVPGITYNAGTSYKGTVQNVPSGNYFIKFYTLGSKTYKTISAATGDDSYNREFYVPIDIPPYKDIMTKINTTCLNGEGELVVDITDGTPVFPFVYSLFTGANPISISSDTAYSQLDLDTKGIKFQNLPIGSYQIQIISGYSAATPNGCVSTLSNALSITCAAPLPIELMSFNVQNNDCSVLINWATASERNNKQFKVYRSKDGDKWELVGTIDGAGNSSTIHTYQMVDNQVSNDVYYYHLKQVDYNGNAESFNPKSVTVSGCTNYLTIYPNPATDKIAVVMSIEQLKGRGNLSLVNVSGAIVLQQSIDLAQEQQQFEINTSELSSGVYLVKFSTEEENYPIRKLMILR